MSEDNDRDEGNVNRESWLTSWEEQCIKNWEEETNLDDRFQNHNDTENHDILSQKLWLSFQNSATAIAQLYKERCNTTPVSLWVPFQNAASGVTMLYKDSVAAAKHSAECASRCGYQRRTREVLGWLKQRKRRHIRRDDLIAYLCGKSPPPVRSLHHLSHGRSPHGRTSRGPHGSPVSASRLNDEHPPEPDLRPFRDALALQCLDGAMSNVSMSYDEHSPTSASAANPLDTRSATDTHRYVLDEMLVRSEGRKRSNSSNEHHTMDSPTRKRSRLL